MVRTTPDRVREEPSERLFVSASPVGILPAEARQELTASALFLVSPRDVGAERKAAGWRWKMPAGGFAIDPVEAVRQALLTEADRGTLFLFFPVLFAGGSVAYFAASAEPAFSSLVAGAATLSLLMLLARSRRAMLMVLAAMLTVVLGVLAAKIETWRAGTKVIGSEISTRLTGRIVEIENQPNGRVRLTIDAIATEHPVLRYAPDRVRLSARRIPPGIVAGAEVFGVVRLRPPSGPVRPGSYDFSFQSYFNMG